LVLAGEGSYRMSGGTLTLGGDPLIGFQGAGTLHITSGMCRVNRFSAISVGFGNPQTGTITRGSMIIAGEGTTYLGEPLLGERGGVYIGFGTSTQGTVIVRHGAFAHLGRVSAGILDGAGTLLVQSGAQVQASLLAVGHEENTPEPTRTGSGTVIPMSRLTIGSLSFNVGATQGGSGRLIVNDGTLTIHAGILGPSGPHLLVRNAGTFQFHGGHASNLNADSTSSVGTSPWTGVPGRLSR
jgi:hypothetical protein